MKKLGLSILFTLGLSSLVILSCCREEKKYWQPVTMNADLFSVTNTYQYNDMYTWSKTPLYSEDTTAADTVLFNLNLKSIFVAENNNSFYHSLSGLNSAFATPKCAPGIHGVKHKAQTVKLTSNEEFMRSEEHTSELQSRPHLVCRLLLEKKKKKKNIKNN